MSLRCLLDGRWVIAAIAAVAVGCGGPEDPVDSQQDEDVGVEEDVGPQQDVDAGDDTDVDDGDDTDPDEGIDGPGDNCPELSNPDQADRSRDGIGDACDHYPFFHDPTNPDHVEVIPEEEFVSFDHWDLPLVVEGNVSDPLEGGSGQDWYIISVDEPTTLLVHVEAVGGAIWPAAIIQGYGSGSRGNTRNYVTPMLGPMTGQSETRDVHLPVPGEYAVVVSDVQNFLPSEPPAGGDDHEYRLWVSTPPLPEPEIVTLPAPQQVVPYGEGEAYRFTVDVTGEDTLSVEATGAPRNRSSMLIPSVQLRDSDTGEMLAYTTERQADSDTFQNRLVMKLDDDLQRVDVLVEAHTSLGDNDIVVDIDTIEKQEHAEPLDDPRVSRYDPLLWLRPGSAPITSMIAPPIVEQSDQLEPDVDFFSLYPNTGELIRVQARPVEESRLVPELSIGTISPWQPGGGDEIIELYYDWHRGADDVDAGEPDTLSALITDDVVQDTVVRVDHADNSGADLPVGGPDYIYDLEIERLDPREEAQRGGGEFPASLPVELPAGQQGLYDFDFEVGYEYRAEFDGRLGRELQLVDLFTGELLAATRDEMTFVYRPDRDPILGVRDERNRDITEEDELQVEVEQLDAPETIEIPDVIDAELEGPSDRDIFRFEPRRGDLVEVRVEIDEDDVEAHEELLEIDVEQLVELELIGNPEQTAVGEGDDTLVRRGQVLDDTEMLVVVTADEDADIPYELHLDLVETHSGEVPVETRETAEAGETVWWHLTLDESRYHTVNVVGDTVDERQLSYSIHDATTMKEIADGQAGGILDSGDINDVYVAVENGTDEVGLSVAPVAPTVADGDSATVEFEEGLRPAVVAYDTEQSGAVIVDADTDDDRRVATQIAGLMNYKVLTGESAQRATAVVADDDPRRLRIIVFPVDDPGEDWEAQIDFDLVATEDAVALESNEAVEGNPLAVDEASAVYTGRLDGQMPLRSFEFDAEEGDELWALAIPAGETSNHQIDPVLRLVDPDGTTRTADERSGPGLFPALDGVTAVASGSWTVELEVDENTEDAGGFVLFFVQRS